MKRRNEMYSIGQVLFIVLSKKSQVVPMQVVEIITKKTLGGEDVKYLLRLGPDDKHDVMLDQIDGEVFESADEVRNALVSRASLQIRKLVDSATSSSKEWYGTGSAVDDVVHEVPETPQKTATVTESDTTPLEEMSVMLPDGTVAKIRLPGST